MNAYEEYLNKTGDKKLVFTDCTRVPDEYFNRDINTNKIEDQNVHFNFIKFELIPFYGSLVYVEGAQYPRKVISSAEIVYRVNIVKEYLKQTLQHPDTFLFGKDRFINNFNLFFKKSFPYDVRNKYLCPTARSLKLAIVVFLVEIGVDKDIAQEFAYNFCHIIEFDDAYRFRLQDMATECNLEALKQNPRKEIRRLLNLFIERHNLQVMNHIGVVHKTNLLVTPLLWILLIPKYKRAFLLASNHIQGMVYDESDWYWTAFKDNYKFGGKTHEERIAEGIPVPLMYIDR